MPTFPCLGGNKKKKRKKREKLDFARAFLRPSGNDFDRGKDVDTNSLRRGRGRRRERRRSFPRPLSRAHIDVESFLCVCSQLEPLPTHKIDFFYLSKKKESSGGEKKKGIEIPKPEKRKKNKNN